MLFLGTLFAAVGRNGSASTVVIAAIFGALGGAASLIVHELGHVRAARRTDGVIALKVTLITAGAATYLDGAYRSGRDQIRVAVGGPAASLLLAVPLMLVLGLPIPTPVKFASFLLALLNVAIGVVSMLPLNPLDGHKFLVGLVWSVVGSESRARDVIRRATRVLIAFEAVSSVALIAVRPIFGGCVALVVAVVVVERHITVRRSPVEARA
jgi:Zn-dependent protease